LLYPDDQQFDAYLPRLEKAVRITGLYDAQVFTRRWIIRDKDPALKALMRCLDKARSSETAASALLHFKNALASRGLFPDCVPVDHSADPSRHPRTRSIRALI